MATELHLRLWWDDADPMARFLDLVDVVAAWPPADATFQGVALRDGRMQKTWSDAGISTARDLRASLAGRDLGVSAVSTGSAFEAWRFQGTTPVAGHLRLGVESWGAGWRPERERNVEGDAALWMQTAGPFVALLGDSEVERQVNERVEENLERLLDLCQTLIRELGPVRLMVWTDAGLSLPVNAHLAWYREPGQVLHDLRWMRTLWEQGLPAYKIPPLREPDTPQSATILHGWRSLEQRTRLWHALQERIVLEAQAEDVVQTLRSGAFDTLTHGDGFLVLDYPHPLNTLLDRFYLAILERAGARVAG